MSKHTAAPWVRDDIGRIRDADGNAIRVSSFSLTMTHDEEADANEDLIFRAVNAYAALLAAAQSAKDELERLMAILGDEDYATVEAVVEQLAAAIKLAEGEA